MAKVKIEVVGAFVDGHAPGTQINVEEKSAKYLESIGYAKVLPPTPKKTVSKKPTRKASAKKKQSEEKPTEE